MSTLSDLIERVRKADGPDREIDRTITDTIAKWCTCRRVEGGICIDCGTHIYGTPAKDEQGWWPHYTSSLDACLSLLREIKDQIGANSWGSDWNNNGPEGYAFVSRNNVKSGHWFTEAYAKTEPLAMLTAILQALQSREAKSNE